MFHYYGNIHVYSPRAGADNPQGLKFSININLLSICLFPVNFTHYISILSFFPFKCIGDLSLPCRKKGQGHPRVMIYVNYGGPASPMLHTKFRGNRPTGSGEEDV